MGGLVVVVGALVRLFLGLSFARRCSRLGFVGFVAR